MYAAIPPATQYLMVDELIRDGFDPWLGHDLKLHGWVVAGSAQLVLRDGAPGYSFVLQKNGQGLRIFADGPRPALVAAQAELVITGHLIAAAAPDAEQPYALAATDLNTRCARDYRAPALEPEFK